MSKYENLRAESQSLLESNILPFWATRMVDNERGGFYGRIGGGVVPYIQSIIAGHDCLISYIVPMLGVAYILSYALWGSRNINPDIKKD